MTNAANDPSLPRASVLDTLALVAGVAAPTIAMGVLKRRPAVMRIAERLDFNGRAIGTLRRLRRKYGSGPLMLAIPGRAQAVILAPEHLPAVLDATPEPFTPASKEKRSALGHFEPEASLISKGAERTGRRRFNEEALDSSRPVHRMAEALTAPARAQMSDLRERALAAGELDWATFLDAWTRQVRTLVLGEEARDDEALTDMLARLREDGNWAFAHPRRPVLRKEMKARIDAHLARAAPGSLAGRIADLRPSPEQAAADQVAHWLFAFEPGGIAAYRALALLAAHPESQRRARAEAAAGATLDFPLLRSAILESLRLWPTTPAILRETTRPVAWAQGVMPEACGMIIYAPYFHRDPSITPNADAFRPERWFGREPADAYPLVPFSAGPGRCPARNLVPMVGASALAALLTEAIYALQRPGRLDPEAPMPGVLDHFSIRFAVNRPEFTRS